MSLTRKQFLSSMVGVVAGAASAAFLVGCASDDGGDDDAPKNCLTNGTSVDIQSNHGHSVTVSIADVTAGVDKTYSITGSSDHAHSITVSAALFTTLKGNTAVNVTSTSGGGHTHVVNIGCA